MSDYIKREDAIEEINKTLNMFGRDHTITDYDAIDCILTVPSADVVEVVRCKDCKYGRDAVRGNYKHKLNLIDCDRINYEHIYIMRPNDFCSYGERAEA